MYDRERITRIIGDINRYHKDLDILSIRTPGDLADRTNYYALSMVLFSLINAVIDLAEEVVLRGDLGTPSTYREIFSLLERNGIIDSHMNKIMSRLVSYRNRLAREYGEITPDDLLRVLTMQNEVTTFVALVKDLIRQRP